MRPLTSNTQLMLEKTMSGLWSRQTAILDNITNAETPNYKAKYVTFEDTLKSRVRSASRGGRPAAAVRAAVSNTQPQVHEAQESTRMDGNGVNVTEQNVELFRTAMELQYVMQAINSDLTALRTAIKGQ